MKRVNPKKFSKNKTNLAGIILCNIKSSKEDKNISLDILGNWRAAHNYPMDVFKKRLKRVSEKIDKNALSSQRLKRVPSIIKKLNRSYSGKKPTMKLTQVQDIAGCRVIMSNVDLANKIYRENYLKGELKHELIKVNDYISTPKLDGYRSIHLVYKYLSDKKGREDFNGLLIEIQIRSKLQHLWATAIETVDFFTKQAIKSNEGQKKWVDFFKLVSSAFAKLENCPTIKGTPEKEKELYLEIKKKEKKLQVVSKMKHWTKSINVVDGLKKQKNNSHFFLLELDTNLEKIIVTSYSKRQEEKAFSDYSEVEKKIFNISGYDVVLVGADSIQDLKKAYPNYFVDTKDFLNILQKILKKYD